MRLQVLGCGDAFGSGGRFNTCFLLARGDRSVLIDCGATALVAMRRFGVDPNAVAAVVLSHLHADHFGGLPSLILDAQLVSRRTRPLVLIGPHGLRARLEALMEAHFPGSSTVQRQFAIEIVELVPTETFSLASLGLSVTGYPVLHPSGTPSLALRVGADGRIVAYTGDTEWVDTLITAGRDADLLIAECYVFDRKVRYHLDYATLREKLPAVDAKRVLLTHLSAGMLVRRSDVTGCEIAEDGAVVDIQ